MSEQLTHITIVKKEPHKLLPGEVTWHAQVSQRLGCWYIGCPKCHGLGNLGGHTVVERDTGITVSPSILCGCGAHYFIEQNKIRWC